MYTISPLSNIKELENGEKRSIADWTSNNDHDNDRVKDWMLDYEEDTDKIKGIWLEI